LATDADNEYAMIDCTIVREHGDGAERANENRAIGDSKGGLSTKIYVLAGALGDAGVTLGGGTPTARWRG
jgi:hypothetical protein